MYYRVNGEKQKIPEQPVQENYQYVAPRRSGYHREEYDGESFHMAWWVWLLLGLAVLVVVVAVIACIVMFSKKGTHGQRFGLRVY